MPGHIGASPSPLSQGSLGMVSPDEYEAAYYAALTREPLPA